MKYIFKLIVALAIVTASITSCSDDNKPVMPKPDATGTFLDQRDGVTYNWVRYGDQEWMTDNVRFKATKGVFRPDLTPISPAYYDDGSNQKYYNNYGGLYDFTAATVAVPDGWRLPTDEDWNKLANSVDSNLAEAINLKLGGYFNIESYYTRSIDFYTGVYGFYWTATTDETKSDSSYAFCRKIVYNKEGYEQESIVKTNLLNVRCVRDTK